MLTFTEPCWDIWDVEWGLVWALPDMLLKPEEVLKSFSSTPQTYFVVMHLNSGRGRNCGNRTTAWSLLITLGCFRRPYLGSSRLLNGQAEYIMTDRGYLEPHK